MPVISRHPNTLIAVDAIFTRLRLSLLLTHIIAFHNDLPHFFFSKFDYSNRKHQYKDQYRNRQEGEQ